MTEKEIQYAISNAKAEQELTWREIEERSGWVRTIMTRWFDGLTTPRIHALLDVLDALDLELVVRKKENTTHEDTHHKRRRESALY